VLNSSYGQSLIADLLDDGVSGVKGYVYEPYLSAISNPEQLFSCYADGYTMVECYAASNVLLSWMGTVIGDPKMAAYGDRLHDVNVSEVRAPDRLSIGENGTLEVLLENLAPGLATGFLEVRDRQNNHLLANHSMTIPGGNDAGSRLILPINVTPVRTGFVEFLVRWIPEDAHPERIVDNNLALLNIEINAPPVIDELTCSTTTATRGGVVICRLAVTDDFGISGATLSWRYNNSSNPNYIPIMATSQNDGVIWTAAISLPTDAPLDSVDLYWVVQDAQELTVEAFWDDAFNITDASATWYGVHVEGADMAPWLGIDPPIHGTSGWVRGRDHAMTACVIDLDHNTETETPSIRVDGNELTTPSVSSTSGSQTCYQTSWRPQAGGPLYPVFISLYADGTEWSNRSLMPIDLAPSAEFLIVGQSHLDGADDLVEVLVIDEDDPDVDYPISTIIEWPGAGIQSLEGDLAIAPPGLESGDATITAQITDGIWAEMQWTWTRPVFLKPPIISTPTLCENDISVGSLNRGEGGAYVWVGVTDGRPIENAGIKFRADSNNEFLKPSIFFDEMIPSASCAPGTGQDSHFYRMQIDESFLREFPLGPVELTVNLHDIDGITGLSETLVFELHGSKPALDFSAMPTEFTSGNSSTLIVEISDPDGMENMECSILLKDEDEITLFSEIYRPDADGLWSQSWIPPGHSEANHTLYFACLDETSLSVSESVLLRAREALPVTSNEENTTQQGVDGPSSTITIAGILVALILLIALTSILIGRREDMPIVEDDELPDDVWAKRDEDVSDEVLTEMAGLETQQMEAWSDEQLLAAGWTQEQIEDYRGENETQSSDVDILGIINEEE
jgi:hypothetical protein